jgi:hypothetical protein
MNLLKYRHLIANRQIRVNALVSANRLINKLMYHIADKIIANRLTNLIITLSKYSILNYQL